MKRLILIGAACLAGPATAQTVYKCAGPQGSIYQSLPCPAENDTGQTLRYVKDPKLSYEERARNDRMLEDARRRMQSDAGRGAPVVRGTVIDSARDSEACQNAKWHQGLAEASGRQSQSQTLQRKVLDVCGSR